MFRIMLLLCYSLIDTNTIPFYFSTVSDRKSRTMHSAVRTYRIISSVSLLILRVLSHGRSIYFYFADASARTSSDTASTWCICGTQKVWVNLLRINCVSLTSLHTRRDAFEGKDPPAGLSSIHILTLDRV